MNIYIEEHINDAKLAIRDEGVFSSDQIKLIEAMIDQLAKAIDRAWDSGISIDGGHGF